VSLSTPDLLRLLLQFALLLALARALGEVARRLGQPQVIGELLAGVVLGPSLLGGIFPGAFAALFPATGAEGLLLQLVAQIGVILLLLMSGLEVDVDLVRRRARPAVLIALGGVLVPFLCGYGFASLLPESLGGAGAPHPTFALFVATAMSISAIPVIVKILLDMGLMRRDVGQLTVAAGVLNDAAGWSLLAVVSGVAAARALPLTSLGISFFGLLAFAAFCFTWGHRLLRWLVTWVDDRVGGESAALSAVLVAGLAGAAATEALHLEAFLGAFVVGVQLSRIERVGRAARGQLQALTLAVFAPVFFASAGLRVDIPAIARPVLAVITLLLIAVACVGKFAGTYVSARVAGLGHWMSMALGSGMNARGAVEIIVAAIGLQMGVLGVPMYSMIIVMAVATSVIAPPLLRWSLRQMPADPAEEDRLRREAWQARSFLHGLRRMLVPVRDGRYALVAAEIVGHLAEGRQVEAVALQVRIPPAPAGDPLPLPASGTGPVVWSRREIADPAGVTAALLAEAARGYDLVVVGASEDRRGGGLFGPVADALVRSAPCSVLVLRAPGWRRGVPSIRRILVPTTGTRADLRVAEFAVALARGAGAEVVALHVVENRALMSPFGGRAGADLGIEMTMGRNATQEVADLGAFLGVPVAREVHTGSGQGVAAAIVQFAAARGCDLILLAGEPRPMGPALHCGRTVSEVVRTARGPVAVLIDEPGRALLPERAES
jgi:Kef-type K+ transport system membrane component KefB/nucleotide-binding universal stress UspA family protein